MSSKKSHLKKIVDKKNYEIKYIKIDIFCNITILKQREPLQQVLRPLNEVDFSNMDTNV